LEHRLERGGRGVGCVVRCDVVWVRCCSLLASPATNARVNWGLKGRYVFSGVKRGKSDVSCCGFSTSGVEKGGEGVGHAVHCAVVWVW
jgi:hypothetical protein